MTREQKERVDNLILKIKELDKFADEIEKEIDTYKNEIKGIMTETKEDDVTTNYFHIVWKVVLSPKFNSTEFKRECPELAKKYTHMSESRPFKYY